MKKNFYNNPIKLIWYSRSSLLPVYLRLIWVLIVLTFLFGTKCFDFINFSEFDINKYFSSSITGLTFTLALFTAEKNVFKKEELKILANHKNEKDSFKGQALIELLGPFVFTAIIFLITGLLSLIVPYLSVSISKKLADTFIQIYLDLLVLGLFSLFNLVITMLNDVYHSVAR